MATTAEAGTAAGTAAVPADRRPGRLQRILVGPLTLIPVTGVLLYLLGQSFLNDPSLLAPTRDPAWYTWRTQLLLRADPALLISKHGPFGMLSGGYRITTPIVGALLDRVAGVHPYTFTILLMVAMPVAAALALGAFANRHKDDALIVFTTMAATVGLFLCSPYLGYLDDGMCLYLLAVTLPFLEPARTSWGARSAIGLLLFLAVLTHPPTAAAFAATLGAGAALRFVTTRFSLRRTLDVDGPALAAAAAGLALGALFWRLGGWGPTASFSDAAQAQPYTSAFFLTRLHSWIRNVQPSVVVPLCAVALGWILWRGLSRKPVDTHSRFSALWLLPLVGILGFRLGLTYPYYRFIDTTLAPMLLAGIGVWLLPWMLMRRGGVWRVAGGVLAAGLVAVLVVAFQPRLAAWDKQSRWIGRDTFVAMVGARGYAAKQPDHPLVFVLHPKPNTVRLWGVTQQFANITLGPLSGDQAARTFLYVGDPSRLAEGRPTTSGDPTFDRLSRGFLADLQAGLARYPEPPLVFAADAFNHSTRDALLDSGVPVVPGLTLLRAPGWAKPSPVALAAARQARQEAADALELNPGALSDPGHLFRVLWGLALLLVIPGLLAVEWFGLRDFISRFALVPGLSLALVAAAAILVVAVRRAPFGVTDGWISVGLAIGAGAVLGAVARRSRWGRSRRPARPEGPEAVGEDMPLA